MNNTSDFRFRWPWTERSEGSG